MKAYEAAKKLGMSSKEFVEEHGLGSHMQSIPVELEAELFGDEKKIVEEQAQTETVNTAEADVVETETGCPYPPKVIRRSILVLGNKSPCWEWRHILEE